jgi:hypothetical protein
VVLSAADSGFEISPVLISGFTLQGNAGQVLTVRTAPRWCKPCKPIQARAVTPVKPSFSTSFSTHVLKNSCPVHNLRSAASLQIPFLRSELFLIWNQSHTAFFLTRARRGVKVPRLDEHQSFGVTELPSKIAAELA